MANTYTIMLQAVISPQSLALVQNQINALQTKLNSAVSGGASGGGNVIAASSYKSLVAQQALTAELTRFKGISGATFSSWKDNDGLLTRVSGNWKDSIRGVVTETSVWNGKQGELFTKTKDVGGQLKINADHTKNWTDNIVNNTAKVVQWALATMMIYGSLKKLSDGVQYLIDLNKELVNIQQLGILGASTNEEIIQLATSYNQLAKAMGVTTEEVVKGSTEYLRQGYTIEQTQKLLQATLMLSKLGNLDAAQATEYLVATTNGFGIAAEDASKIVGKLVAVDNIAATSAGELATALQYTSAVAKQSGVTFDQMVAMIGTVSSRTRLSAETIGQAFKTMLTRMEQVKAGATIDDMGESLNNVEKVLKTFNITLRDNVNEFRPMGEVLDEISSKWNTYGTVQQQQIAGAIAGVRQQNIFLSLMQNYADVAKYTSAEVNSLGLETQRYGIYLAGVEAAANKASAAWQGVWQKTISSDVIKFFYELSGGLANAISNLGGLVPVVIALGIAFGVLARVKIAAFFVALNASLGPIGWALIAISAVTLIVANSWKSAADKLQELNQQIDEHKAKLDSLRSSANQLASIGQEYETLRTNTSRTSDENKRFLDLQNQIHGILPQLSGEYDDMGNYILTAGINLETLNRIMRDNIVLEQASLRLKIVESIDAKIKGLKDLQKEQSTLNDRAKYYNDIIAGGYGRSLASGMVFAGAPGELDKVTSDASQNAAELTSYLETMRQEYLVLDDAQRQMMISQMLANGVTQETIDLITTLTPIIEEVSSLPIVSPDAPQTVEELTTEIDKLIGAANGLISSYETLQSAMEEQEKNGQISIQTAMQLISAGYAEAISVNTQTGALSINYQMLRTVAIEKAQEAANNAWVAYQNRGTLATNEQTSALLKQWQVTMAIVGKLKSLPATPALFGGILGGGSVGGGGGGQSAADREEARIRKEKEREKKDLQDLLKDYKKLYDEKVKGLKEELKNYKEIIDVRKELLKSLHDEKDYNDSLAEREKGIASIKKELIGLSFDTSEEANRKRMELEEQLAEKQADLENFQEDKAYQDQIDALDKEAKIYDDFINKKIEILDAEYSLYEDFINNQIDALDDFLDRLGDILRTGGGGGGGGGDDKKVTITRPVIKPTTHPEAPRPRGGGTKYWMSEGGLITGGTAGTDSVPIMAMPGEFILTKKMVDSLGVSALNRLNMGGGMPSTNNLSGGNSTIEMPITVMGNLDKTVLPDMEKIINKAFEKMNSTMMSRGYKRAVNQYVS